MELQFHLHLNIMALLLNARSRSFSPLRASPNSNSITTTSSNNNVALVWFKHDLRIDDHPALISSSSSSSASRYTSVLPLYIFDHRILSRFSDATLELALLALQDLKASLQHQGSDLIVRFGEAESIISEFAKQFGDVDVFAQEEVEYHLLQIISSLRTSCPNVVMWRTPFYNITDLNHLPEFYSDFEKLKLPVTTPLETPVLPRLEFDIDRGSLPTFDEVKRYMNAACPQNSNERWTSIKDVSAGNVLGKASSHQLEIQSELVEKPRELDLGDADQNGLNAKRTKRRKLKKSVFTRRKDNVVAGGTSIVLNAFAAFLKYLEGTSRDDWQEVHQKLCDAETRSGTSFGTLFSPALSLGIVSRRRIHYEAAKYEKERNAGFLCPFGYSAATVAAAVNTVCSMEWYWLMALRSQTCNDGRNSVRIWRWNGYLLQYTVVGHEGPAVLLVHGFGAFFEHYRHNLKSLADHGNRVWAITLLGFGKSEKPNIVYTEVKWAELLRDFIVEVVGEPAHLVGNSIGGYLVAIVAGLWPAMAKSVVLINTAGFVNTGKTSISVNEERRVSMAAWLGSWLLLLYLRLSVGNIVKNCYPCNRAQADDWLINEMLRASHDPGVLEVLESVFSFNLLIPLNYLFESFGGQILVIQGMKDPLLNSKVRLPMLRECCRGIVIKELDAGHCPHDERPEEVNPLICEWIATMESNIHIRRDHNF